MYDFRVTTLVKNLVWGLMSYTPIYITYIPVNATTYILNEAFMHWKPLCQNALS